MPVCSWVSFANPKNTVNISVPKAKNKVTRMTIGLSTPKKYPMKARPGNMDSQAMMQAVKDHGHKLARTLRVPGERWVRHQVNGEWILVATTAMRIPRKGGKMPPPARSMAMEIRIMTRPPFFRCINRVAHTSKAREKRMARIPVTSRLGMTVIAGSPPRLRKKAESGQDMNMTPLGATLP